MLHVALIGASGNVGQRLTRELADRGHKITAIARHPENIPGLPGVTAHKGDITDTAALTALLKGHDAVISAVRFQGTDAGALIAAVRASGVKRYLVVGGAGSLEVTPGKMLIDTPEFPDAYKAEATPGVTFLAELKKADDLEWTFLSPSAMFGPGARTGKFRLGTDQLLNGQEGSHISFEDFAVAMADEIEHPAHIRRRFTVGY